MSEVVFIPVQIHKLSSRLFAKPLTKNNFIGLKDWSDYGQMYTWDNGSGVQFGIPEQSLEEPRLYLPKVSVIQDKSIRSLVHMVAQQQFFKGDEEKYSNSDVMEPTASFTFKNYARLLGYSDEEIRRGGNFISELRQVLIAGAATYYKVINEKGIIKIHEPFYSLALPAFKNSSWSVNFNALYAEQILEVINGCAEQFYTHSLQELADRYTSINPIMHRFYNKLVHLRPDTRKTTWTIPMKVSNLFENIYVPDCTLKRVQCSFELFVKLLNHFSSAYPHELTAIRLLNPLKRSSVREYSTEKFKSLCLLANKDFVELLPTGMKDFRECLISFNMPG